MSAPRPVPDVLFERLALGELSPDEEAALRARVAPERIAARLEALRRSDAAILEAHPPRVVAAALAEGARRPARRRGWPLVLAAAPALAAGVLLLALRTPAAPGEAGRIEGGAPVEVTRIKGDAALLVYRRTPQGPEPMASGEDARPGDVLQLAYRAAGATHGLLASLDGRGAVTLHFPASEAASTALPAKDGPLPFSYQLDDAPGFERFVLLLSDAPLDVGRALARLRAAGRRGTVDLGPEVRTLTLTLNKPSGDAR